MSELPVLEWRGEGGAEVRSLARDAEGALARPARSVVIRGIPDAADSAPLLGLAAAFGHFLACPRHASPEELARQVVSIRSREEPTVREGLRQESESSRPLHMHTDGAGMERPFDLILLYCVVPDPGGGDSLVAPLERILARLAPGETRVLREPLFPFPWGLAPILYGGEADPRIRFHRVYLDAGAEKHGVRMDQRITALYGRLGAVARSREVAIRTALASGECLIMDNTRTLHGRTELQRGSLRWMKRVRVFRDSA